MLRDYPGVQSHNNVLIQRSINTVGTTKPVFVVLLYCLVARVTSTFLCAQHMAVITEFYTNLT